MRMKTLKVSGVLFFLTGLFFLPACAQVIVMGPEPLTRADTLRGSLRPERNC